MNYKEALEKKIKEIATKWGRSNIYYVGGYVRDELIEKFFPEDIQEIRDADLVIDLENGAQEFIKFLKSEYPDNCTDFAEYPRFGTAKFTLHFDGMIKANGAPWIREQEIECVSPRAEEYVDGPRKPSSIRHASIKEDAMRRDFCCNAVYKNVVSGEIFDPTGKGIEDIKNKILRTPLDPITTYKDDPLRMLRVIRFAARKGFAIEEKTFKAISPIPEYYQLSMERVNSEFSQILMSYNPVKYIWMLHDTGLLGYIIPEFEEAWGFNQNSKYHSLNLTDHCLEVLNKVIKNSSARSSRLLVRLAALLHDISKYKIHETSSDGTFSFHGHEIDSSNMARDILTRLKYSNDDIDRVCFLIENHMRIKSQYNYDTKQYTGTKKSMGKLIKTIDAAYNNSRERFDILEDLMKLIDADNLSHSPKWNMPGQVSSFYEKYNEWVLGFARFSTSTKSVVSGKDIMDRFKIGPGKTIGYIKNEIIAGFQAEHPNYDKDTLLDMYEAEFGGKSVYIWADSNRVFSHINVSIVKPVKSARGYGVDDYRDGIEMDEREIGQYADEVHKNGGLIVLDAIQYPELFIRCRIRKRSREILDKVWKDLSELQEMPGFEKVTLDLDNSNDVSARVDWKDHRSDYIF